MTSHDCHVTSRQKWVRGDADTKQYILGMCLGEVRNEIISQVNFLAFPCEIIYALLLSKVNYMAQSIHTDMCNCSFLAIRSKWIGVALYPHGKVR